MSRVPPWVVGVAATLLAASSATAQPKPPPEDETSPALLQLIRAHLAEVSGLGTADGVQVEETRFFRGTLRVRGTVASAEQRDAVRREIAALRPRLEMSVDVRITDIDISGLKVEAATTPPTTGSETPQLLPLTPVPTTGDFGAPWPFGGPVPDPTIVSITPWWPPFPPPSFSPPPRRHARRRAHVPPPPPPPFFFLP